MLERRQDYAWRVAADSSRIIPQKQPPSLAGQEDELVDYPLELNGLEFTRIRFVLEFQDCFCFDATSVMRLRRELRQALQFDADVASGDHAPLARLLHPTLSSDPQALRKFQKPSPGFIIVPPKVVLECEVGDEASLEVIFWGTGTQLIADFFFAMQRVGASGFCHGKGPFEIVGIQSLDGSNVWQEIWQLGDAEEDLTPLLHDLAWWLDKQPFEDQQLELRFMTPARLLHKGKPLFNPNFPQLFPFVLRRVTAMLHAWQGVELKLDPRELTALVARVEEMDNQLFWQDWRTLNHTHGDQELGGLTGYVRLSGLELREISWILRVGVLLNIGKGAAYGCGCYTLELF